MPSIGPPKFPLPTQGRLRSPFQLICNPKEGKNCHQVYKRCIAVEKLKGGNKRINAFKLQGDKELAAKDKDKVWTGGENGPEIKK